MIFIITAYRAEAEPFLKTFDFDVDKSVGDFQVFRSEAMVLGISGEGKKYSAKLTESLISGYVHAAGIESSFWLNFGIAGSGSHRLGTLIYADQVIDAESNNLWDLSARDFLDFPVMTVKTVTRPSREYQEKVAYDMEASGILQALSKHSLTQQALVLKLITDGPDYPFHRVAKSDVLEFLTAAEQKLHSIINALPSGG